MFFFKNGSQNRFVTRHLLWAFSALSFGRHSSHITPRDCPEAFTGVYVHPRGYGAVNPPGRTPTFWQIWDLDLWILNSNKMSGTLPGVFTAPHPRWWTYTPVNASGQSLGVMWELCRPNQSAEQAHRRCRAKRGILRFVFGKKTCTFWPFQKFDFEIWGGQGDRENF